MASRKSRSRRSGTTATRARTTERRDLVSPSMQPVAQASASVANPVESTIEWSSEYHYVVNDLRQLLMISAVLFVAMLVVGYFL